MQSNISKVKFSITAICDYVLRSMPYIFVFVASLARPTDLDLGWHLKYGEYFFKTGKILRENIFSAEMTEYHYVNHSWATDIFTYVVFNKFGFVGISVFSALIMVLMFYFFARAARLSFWDEAFIFPFILYISYGNIGMSFRGQLLSILFLGVLYFLIRMFEDRKNIFILLLTIPLFFVWANMHGGFILGLVVLGIWCSLKYAELLITRFYNTERRERRQLQWQDILPAIIGACSVVATLINPFGWKIYQEIFRHTGNPLQKYVNEWGHISGDQFLFWAYVISGALLLIGIFLFYRKKQKLEALYFLIPVIIFWILAYQQRRYFWSALFVAMPFFGSFFSLIKPSNKKIALCIAGTILAGLYLWVSFVKLPSEHLFSMDWVYYCRINGCSQKSAEYLIKNKLSDKMFSDYNFGGWLIWNYPEIKPSIDGRMSFWKDDFGYSAFEKYVSLENNIKDIDKSEYDTVYISPLKKNIFNRLQQLVRDGKWRVAYYDLSAYVFVRIK